jgi:GNAT superfamily N-acetyltransferase
VNENIVIRTVTANERDTVSGLFLAMLKHLHQFGHDVPPTQENAEWFTDNVFLPAATKGDPVLIARINEAPVGAIFWCRNPAMPGLEGSAFGYGTYVVAKYQRQGVGLALRTAAVECLKDLGVKRIIGAALKDNVAGHASLLSLGMEPTTTLYELKI